MLIEFNRHDKAEVEFEHIYQPGEIDLDDETAQIAGELRVSGAARRNNSEIAKVRGRLLGRLAVNCRRCLHPLETALEVEFDEEFITLEMYVQSSAEHELKTSDLALSIYDGERIDIDELVREQVLLNLPTHQICSENCAGLCLACGANKNEKACSCADEEIDPRWNALRELKSKK